MEQRGLGDICIRASMDDSSGLLGLCDSDDHAYDEMIMIAGYYRLYHSNG